ncbi:hypothetical protein HYPSUDRAFT_68349 [Hypholoma sublateritium FD-334 SS-4]|uniref:Uncharacterized protein n=1 Tax=Hypholoma sublateritium (strain FD-334 SS-4) TaxID=945553 RepID=A0A0D2PL10_HYPSF|nr:hypothetical protein HYPSUDRAFT_68349 [Hypholoma sublateritium FD-334 SS-4]
MNGHPYSYQSVSLAQQEISDKWTGTRPRAMSTSRASVDRYVLQGSYGSSIPFQEERLDTGAKTGSKEAFRYRSAYKNNLSHALGSLHGSSYSNKNNSPTTHADDPYGSTGRRYPYTDRPRSTSRYQAKKEEEIITDDFDECEEDMSDTEAKMRRSPYSKPSSMVTPTYSGNSAGNAQPLTHRGRRRAESSAAAPARGPMRPQSRASTPAAHQGHESGMKHGEAKTYLHTNTRDPIARPSAERPHYVLREEYNELSAKLQRSQDELEHSRSEMLTAQNACEALRRSNSALQNELREVKRALGDSLRLSAVRGKELVGSQVFLSKANLLSVSELKQKVARLNDENFQAAAWLAEFLVRREGEWMDDKMQAAYIDHILGKPMLHALTIFAKGAAPTLLVQLILQIFLTWFCCAKIERWQDNNETTNTFLRDMYRKIRCTEEQAVSGRWRAITHTQARISASNWASEVSATLVKILPISGYDPSSYPQSEFEEKLEPIFKAILDLRIALGEHFTSSDIEPYMVPPGRRFDPQIMEDSLADGRLQRENQDLKDVKSDMVVATSGMGLYQWVPSGSRGGSGSYQLVMLPEVIRQSTLNELLQLPPSKESSSRRSTNSKHSRV